MNNISQTLLLLTLACTVGLIFADELPGEWWQWLLATVVLLVAAASASNTSEGD